MLGKESKRRLMKMLTLLIPAVSTQETRWGGTGRRGRKQPENAVHQKHSGRASDGTQTSSACFFLFFAQGLTV